jgi:hypothetical protein
VRDHYRGPVEDQARRRGGYTRGQLAFLTFANGAAVYALYVLIGSATALIYVLALALGMVLGVPWAYERGAAAAPTHAIETLKRVDQLTGAALGALTAGRTDDAKARLHAISDTTLVALEERSDG